MSMNKPVAYIMVGLPGSGKSTYVETELAGFKHDLVSSDAYIEAKAKEEGKTYGEVFQKYVKDATKNLKNTLDKAIAAKHNIICDQTHMSRKARKEKIDKLQGYEIIAVTFEIPLDELKRRRDKRVNETGKTVPQHIMDSMATSYQPPEYSEGFDEIIVIKA